MATDDNTVITPSPSDLRPFMVHIEKPEKFSGVASSFKRWQQRNAILSHDAASSTVPLGGSTGGR
ncbi:hypothetical protein ACS0TY_018805 [Phlomoides rotata]